MNLVEKIKIELKDKNLENIIEKMGYINISKGLRTLENIINAKILFVDSNFDYNHYTRSFIMKLCEILNIDKDFYLSEIKKLEDFAYAYRYTMQPSLRIHVSPCIRGRGRWGAYSIENKLIISLDREKYVQKDLKSKIKEATKVMNEHYQKNNGILIEKGKEVKITSYTFNYDHEESIELFPDKIKK